MAPLHKTLQKCSSLPDTPSQQTAFIYQLDTSQGVHCHPNQQKSNLPTCLATAGRDALEPAACIALLT